MMQKNLKMSFRVYFNRPLDTMTDYVSFGGYEVEMDNHKTIQFDFEEYSGSISDDGKMLLVEHRYPDFDVFPDIESLIDISPKHIDHFKEFYIYMGEHGESPGLKVEKITDICFENWNESGYELIEISLEKLPKEAFEL